MSALREYLLAQADLGMDEVILPSAPAKPVAPGADSVSSGRENASQRKSGAPQANPPQRSAEMAKAEFTLQGAAGGESSLLQMLNSSIRANKSETQAAVAAAQPTPRATETQTLPAFGGLPAFWEHLESNRESVHGMGGALVRAEGPQHAPLAMVGLQPSEEDAAAGKAFQGAAGALLEKMMRAIHLDMEGLYRTNLIKVHAPGKAWSRRELVRLLPWLHAELTLVQAPFTLLLGEACAQVVLKTGQPLEDLRQVVHRIEGREFVVTWHPEDLLRDEGLKRKAWVDLQWLEKRLR